MITKNTMRTYSVIYVFELCKAFEYLAGQINVLDVRFLVRMVVGLVVLVLNRAANPDPNPNPDPFGAQTCRTDLDPVFLNGHMYVYQVMIILTAVDIFLQFLL